MNKTHLETFRGLINQFDLDLNYNMKLSSIDKVLEDSMSFLSSLYEKKINIDIDTGSLLNYSKKKYIVLILSMLFLTCLKMKIMT